MKAVVRILEELGGIVAFAFRVLRVGLTTRGNLGPILAQVADISYRSLPTVACAGAFVGAILVIQFNLILSRYDAQMFLGGLNTSAVIRQVGPLIISFLLAGKIGAFTAAELGTMRVTEQIDAIKCLGTDPIQFLIVPRFMAIVFSSLCLLLIGLMISVLGAMGVASAACGVNPIQFLASVPRFSSGWTLGAGMLESLVYGFIVASVSCYKGFTASGGARGVGRAVTQAAVFTNLYIVLANYLMSVFLTALEAAWSAWQGGFTA